MIMPYKTQAELDEALRVGTVADAVVEAEGEGDTDEPTKAPAEGGTAAKDAEAGGAAAPDVSAADQTDGAPELPAGEEPAAPVAPEVSDKPKAKGRS